MDLNAVDDTLFLHLLVRFALITLPWGSISISSCCLPSYLPTPPNWSLLTLTLFIFLLLSKMLIRQCCAVFVCISDQWKSSIYLHLPQHDLTCLPHSDRHDQKRGSLSSHHSLFLFASAHILVSWIANDWAPNAVNFVFGFNSWLFACGNFPRK